MSTSIVDDHTHTHSASASVIEHFQALLKQKEGELANAQVHLPDLNSVICCEN